MNISTDFPGGNIKVLTISGDYVRVECDLRDTEGDWFYWAFCVEGAGGRTLTFDFGKDRIGYFGPAVSHDLKVWNWAGGGRVWLKTGTALHTPSLSLTLSTLPTT